MVCVLLEYDNFVIESAKQKHVSQLDKLQNSSLDYNYSDTLCPAVKGVMYECGFEDLAHRRRHHFYVWSIT